MIKGDTVAIIETASDLMPKGVPKYEDIRYYPSINQLVERYTRGNIRKVLMAIVKNFCDSYSLPDGKNMNASQMLETACYLLDECDNYRIEDYLIMFTMAKRGKLEIANRGRVFDRIDLQLVSDIKDCYEQRRREWSDILHQQDIERKEKTLKHDERDNPNESEEEKKARWDKVAASLKQMIAENEKERLEKPIRERAELRRKKHQALTEAGWKLTKRNDDGTITRIDLK